MKFKFWVYDGACFVKLFMYPTTYLSTYLTYLTLPSSQLKAGLLVQALYDM